MSQRFVKGRTNNHLTWVMVDATDFATPESALSAATKIKIYGKLRGATGVNFVSSGTGSLTNDIQHVGASVLGIYTIALAKADLSDASAAWYDQYIVSLSATGAAYQTLVVDGGIDDSSISGFKSTLSDLQSYLVVMSGVQSDLYSLVSDFQSDFQSRVPKRVATDSQLSDLASDLRSVLIVNQSVMSDTYSLLSDHHSDFQSRVPKAVATNSQLSDLASDLRSYLVVMSGVQSDVYSLLSDFQSDFQSRVPKRVATDSQLSDMSSDIKSYLAVMSGVQSDLYSLLSDHHSDFQSRVPKLVATNSQLSDLASDIKSAVGAITVSITASDVSDIASAVVAALPITSVVSDIYSLLSDLQSDFQSRVPKRVATDSQLSDMASDIKSAVTVVQSMASDAASAAQQANSRLLVNQSAVSDIYSLLSDFRSDFQSRVPKLVATNSQLSDLASDLKSAIGNIATGGDPWSTELPGAYTVDTAGYIVGTFLKDLTESNIASAVLVELGSNLSDIYSLLSDLHSDVGVMSGVLSDTYSQLSDTHSDLKSAIGNITVTLTASDISDIASGVAAGLTVASQVSDIYSIIQDINTSIENGTVEITVSAPVVDEDGIFPIVQGDDYYNANGRAISVNIPLAVADITGMTSAVMKIQKKVAGQYSGEVDSVNFVASGAGTSSQVIKFEFASADTATLTPSADTYGEDPFYFPTDVEMTLSDGHVATIQLWANVKRQVGNVP